VDRRTRNLFALALVVVIAITGGAALILGGGAPQASGGPSGTTSVVGLVVGVDSAGLTDVRSFRLRTDDGQTLEFGLAGLENGVQFPPSHLAEHQLTASRIRVWYRSGDPLQAIRLEDAP
jgi:hypothetical protein